MIKRELTAAERERPYAKYYDMEMTPPSPELLAQVDHRIPAELILKPENAHLLFEDRPENEVVGWAIQEDGAGYVSNRLEMPGVTPAMLAWWFAWHPMESLRYMIWYPGRHFSAALSPEELKNNLDPDVDILDKIAGVTHIIEEDSRENDALTEVPPAFQISFRHPEEMGITREQIGYPDKGFMVMASPPVAEDGALPGRPRIMMHYAKATETGVTFYSRFWMGGYVVRNGKAEYIGVQNPTPASAPKSLLLHCIREYTHLASFLPGLYREMDGALTLSLCDTSADVI